MTKIIFILSEYLNSQNKTSELAMLKTEYSNKLYKNN